MTCLVEYVQRDRRWHLRLSFLVWASDLTCRADDRRRSSVASPPGAAGMLPLWRCGLGGSGTACGHHAPTQCEEDPTSVTCRLCVTPGSPINTGGFLMGKGNMPGCYRKRKLPVLHLGRRCSKARRGSGDQGHPCCLFKP